MYFASMLLISFNLFMASTVTSIKLMDRPNEIRMFVGGTADLSVGKYTLLNDIFKISSYISFISIWITTALLLNYYREKLIKAVLYWIVLSIPLVYFIINSVYTFIFGNLLNFYLTIDPITVSIILTAFLSLSKPIGGLTFAIAFWRTSKFISYEKNIKAYMVISGWGILLIFGTNQALVQALAPYPPFGLATITVLIIAGYLMLLGIYNSATLVSMNDNLRKFIYKQTSESNLLGVIGRAEKEKEIQQIITKITAHKERLKNIDTQIELDDEQMKKYIEFVTNELRKEKV
ncbi:MAG: hypothetical protein ACE5SW_07120 [Nitrososphaeraceae archaeon]